jgi:hypothetical protein
MAIKFLKGDRGWYCTFLDFAILSLGIGWVIFLLHLSSPKHARFTYLDVERDAGDMLHYGHNTDLTQDVIGFRAICRNQDAYPLLGPAMDKLGVVARVEHRSTHPPTAFLLVGPVAWLPINPGARMWAWMTLACLAGSFYCLGCGAMRSAGFALIFLAWPPMALALGQLTVLWLLGVCVAYRYLSRHPVASGAMLAIASATKLAPVLMLLLLRRNRRALMGFGLTVAIFIGVLCLLSPSCISRYRFVMDHTVPQQSGRPDNASIVGQAHRHFGRTGLLAATIFLLLVFASNCREILRGSLIGWTALSYLAVAALPILWIYSVVPLLFMGRWAWLGGWLAKLIFLTFFIATTLDLTQDSPELLATSVAWLGIGLIATEWMKSGLSLTP